MQNENYIVYEILGIKHTNHSNSLRFSEEAIYELEDDRFIKQIVVDADVSLVSFYLRDSLSITDEIIPEILEHVEKYSGSIMISLLKNSALYQHFSLMPRIRRSSHHFIGESTQEFKLFETGIITEASYVQRSPQNGNDILDKWIRDVNPQIYADKKEKFDILISLLSEQNIVQKYVTMYAYLTLLVQGICCNDKKAQKIVIEYICGNCSRVGLTAALQRSTRIGAGDEDQFTLLRNKIVHPDEPGKLAGVSEIDVNGLAAIICCAIEDTPSAE